MRKAFTRTIVGGLVLCGVLAVSGTAYADIIAPPDGSTVHTTRLLVFGDGTPGDQVVVTAQSGTTEVTGCGTEVHASGFWRCRFENPLTPGEWTLVAVETAPGGGETTSSVLITVDPAADFPFPPVEFPFADGFPFPNFPFPNFPFSGFPFTGLPFAGFPFGDFAF